MRVPVIQSKLPFSCPGFYGVRPAPVRYWMMHCDPHAYREAVTNLLSLAGPMALLSTRTDIYKSRA
jgi:hypothetical protein